MKLTISIALTAGLLLSQAPRLNVGVGPYASKAVEGERSGEFLQMPEDSTHRVYEGLCRRKAVFEFYRTRDRRACWTDQSGTLSHADSMILLIHNLRYYGLRPTDYRLGDLKEAAESGDQLRLEALLSDSFLSLAKDLGMGRLAVADSMTDRTGINLLNQVTVKGMLRETLERQEPPAKGYNELRAALRHGIDSLSGAAREEWLSGFARTSNEAFQKLQQVEVNLERWRSQHKKDDKRYVLINIPSFTLDVIDDGEIVLSSRVIVGNPDTPTPVLNSTIECIVIYPYWHVPRKIAVEEYLPRLQRDTAFLTTHHFDILDRKGHLLRPDSIPWNTYSKDYFPVVMRQREGSENALGLLKFVFDNPYAVFLHDTNTKDLFRNESRAYSHGCVRMEKAEQLAHYLKTDDVNRRSEIVDKALREQQRLSIEFDQPIPIHIVYYTCEVRHGKFQRYRDVYGLDKTLISELYH